MITYFSYDSTKSNKMIKQDQNLIFECIYIDLTTKKVVHIMTIIPNLHIYFFNQTKIIKLRHTTENRVKVLLCQRQQLYKSYNANNVIKQWLNSFIHLCQKMFYFLVGRCFTVSGHRKKFYCLNKALTIS